MISKLLGRARLISALVALAAVGAACSDPVVERSISDVLSEVEGRPLTPAEVATLVQTADMMCGLDDQVLNRMLLDVGEERLPFTDWVFSSHCADREDLYKAVLPERLAEEVEQSDG